MTNLAGYAQEFSSADPSEPLTETVAATREQVRDFVAAAEKVRADFKPKPARKLEPPPTPPPLTKPWRSFAIPDGVGLGDVRRHCHSRRRFCTGLLRKRSSRVEGGGVMRGTMKVVIKFGQVLVLVGAACGQPMATDTENASSEGSTASNGELTGDPAPTDADASSSPTSATSTTTEAPTTGSEALCGDGVVGGDEECDDGNIISTDACLPGCVNARCGDLVIQVGVEECDDGNGDDTDNCTNACQYAKCGDGVVGPGEACDDGNDVDQDGCSNLCILASCGDGEIQPPEDCDEGIETMFCNVNCTESTCGDTILNAKAGEDCDDGGESATCNADCSIAACGDGVLNVSAGEDCDDEGESEACNADCTVAMCGDNKLNVSANEVCDDGGETAACDVDCTAAACGDGVHNAVAGEACDDDGESSTCNDDCTISACGDGKVNAAAGESCDTGVQQYTNFCSYFCTKIKAVAPGTLHVCAASEEGITRCWGYNGSGQLGYGDNMDRGDGPGEMPTPAVNVGGKVLQMSTGGDEDYAEPGLATCARLETGSARCWGENGFGKLGYGNVAALGDMPGELPAPDIAVGASVLQIETGGVHTCTLVAGNTVRCWGRGNYAGLGYGNTNNLLPPTGNVPGITGVVQIALGYAHTCALSMDGTVRCWGVGGVLGLGHASNIGDGLGEMPPPQTLVHDVNDPVIQLAAGYWHTCALLKSGKVRCWGDNFYGQTGTTLPGYVGDAPGEMPPSDVDLGGPAVMVVAGNFHSCALLQTKNVKCWGGFPAKQNVFPPPDVNIGGDVASLHSHLGSFICAQITSGALKCWGDNSRGQLGLGHTMTVPDNAQLAMTPPVPF